MSPATVVVVKLIVVLTGVTRVTTESVMTLVETMSVTVLEDVSLWIRAAD